jgi:hypothetical protein
MGIPPFALPGLSPTLVGQLLVPALLISIIGFVESVSVAQTLAAKKRVIVIHDAHTMGLQAQNAFLKLLEEPTASTHFVLLTSERSSLLPTVTSRAQLVTLRKPTHAVAEALLDSAGVKDATKRSQLLFIADGLPELMENLMGDSELFEQRATIMRDARVVVQGQPYQKLIIAQRYKDARKDALLLVSDAMRLIRLGVKNNPSPDHIKRLERLLVIGERLNANGNVRLQLASLVV